MTNHDIIVMGASSGGVEALLALSAALPDDMPASMFLVLHRGVSSKDLLSELIRARTKLPVFSAADGMTIERGSIYIAPPDLHMLINGDKLQVIRGPKENRHRPAIDPLFRSAAWTYGPRVVGVLLTGNLDDGCSGLWAIKSCGGLTIVQDPEDATYPDMPRNAMLHVDVDYCLALANIPETLISLWNTPINPNVPDPKPANLATEVGYATAKGGIESMGTLGKPSVFTCPACSGGLWEIQEGNLTRYRCHVGHAYSPNTLVEDQSARVEGALYSAAAALQEKATLLRRMMMLYGNKMPEMRNELDVKAQKAEESARLLLDVLKKSQS